MTVHSAWLIRLSETYETFTADSDDAAIGGGGRAAPLLLPALIQAIAAEGRAVRWDAAARWYEVINGPLFEER